MADGVKKVYGHVTKGPLTRLQVQSAEFKGTTYLHVREFFLPDGEEEWRPTKKGTTLNAASDIRKLIILLEKAEKDFSN